MRSPWAWGHGDFASRFAALAATPNAPRAQSHWYGLAYWYWTGQALSRLGADQPAWKAWNNQFKPYLIYTQNRRGRWPGLLTADPWIRPRLERGENLDGAWPAAFLQQGSGAFEDTGTFGATAFACLMLEVYYRY